MSNVTTKREQSPRWMTLAVEVLEGKADQGRNVKSNTDTQNITIGIVKTLMEGFPLSEKQASAFVANIRKRVPGRADFEWDQPIVLTKKQRTDARSNPKYAELLAQLDETKGWTVHLHAVLDSKLREMEAFATDKAEYQQMLGRLYEVIRDYEG